MNHPTFEETSLGAIALNRINQFWNKTHMMGMYRQGKYTGQWETYTWQETSEEQHKLTTAWMQMGLEPQDKVAVISKNRPRMVLTINSLLGTNLVYVPVYPTLVADEMKYVLEDSGAKVAVVDTMERARKVLSVMDDLPGLKKIFVMDPIEKSGNERLGAYDDLLAMAENNVDMEAIYNRVREADGENLAAIIYTSGTTGKPKGVMLTNNNLISQRVVLPLFNLNSEDVFLNHLPFCHSFGFTSDLLGTADTGATLAIAEGMAPEQIRYALTSIRPTVLMSVPRLFEKLYVQVGQVVSKKPAFVQKLFAWSLAIGKQVFDHKNEGRPMSQALLLRYRLAKRILTKIRSQAGMDRVRIAYAGGGPTSKELCYFFQSLGIDIFQGYGLTETSPIANVNVPGNNKLGTVGPPIENVEQRIDDDGEILLRGPIVMKGYHNRPEDTAEAIDKDGWFHTGDIGEFDEDGYLKITDRKKELIITSGGKNIAPLPIESIFNTEAYIEQVVLIGDDRKYLTALVCPNFHLLHDWAAENGLPKLSDAELAARPEVENLIGERIAEVNTNLSRFEQIKTFRVLDHIFTEETGEITPTQKLKRRVIADRYQDLIRAMYPEDEKPSSR